LWPGRGFSGGKWHNLQRTCQQSPKNLHALQRILCGRRWPISDIALEGKNQKERKRKSSEG
jgi:hypothetical protein